MNNIAALKLLFDIKVKALNCASYNKDLTEYAYSVSIGLQFMACFKETFFNAPHPISR